MRPAALRRSFLFAITVAIGGAHAACGRIGYELLDDPGEGAGARGGAGTGGRTGDGGTSTGGLAGGGTGGSAPSGGSPIDSGPDTSNGGSSGGGSGGTSPEAAPPDARSPGDAGSDANVCRPPSGTPDYCVTIPRLCAPPVIDGVLDPGAPIQDLVPVGWNVATPMPPDSTTRFAAAYREDGLYVFAEVTDSTRIPAIAGDEVWRGDGIEIYVDADGVYSAAPAFDNPGSRQIQAAAPVDAVTSSTRGELYTWGFAGTRVPWTSNFVVVPTPTGYALEAFITATELAIPAWTLAAGASIGFDLGLNLSDPDATTYAAPDGHRLGQYFFHVTAGGTPPFFDVGAFCRPTLAP